MFNLKSMGPKSGLKANNLSAQTLLELSEPREEFNQQESARKYRQFDWDTDSKSDVSLRNYYRGLGLAGKEVALTTQYNYMSLWCGLAGRNRIRPSE